MEISKIYEIFKKCPNVITDSREARSNSIFVALKGDTTDGNKYVYSAIENGANYAIADDKSLESNDKIIIVDDALKTLQDLASYHRSALNIPMLAITGSNGKTTTKELTNCVLSKKYNVAVTQGNFNNHIGVPKTLLDFNSNHNFAVVEMGTNHFGEIETLCNIAKPNFGLINNIGKAHLEFFENLDGVAKAKGELFKFLAQTGGKAFVNTDIDLIKSTAEQYFKEQDIIQYNNKEFNLEIFPSDINNPFLSFKFNDIVVNSKLIGNYNIDNALAAIAVGKYFGVPDTDIAEAIAMYTPNNHRSQKITTERNILFMDAYNANPTSMQVALNNFIAQPTTNKMLIIGEMRELGTSSEAEHRAIVELIKKSNIKDVVLVGQCFETIAYNAGFIYCNNVEECNEYIGKNNISGKTILIKGSHGIHLEKTEQYL